MIFLKCQSVPAGRWREMEDSLSRKGIRGIAKHYRLHQFIAGLLVRAVNLTVPSPEEGFAAQSTPSSW